MSATEPTDMLFADAVPAYRRIVEKLRRQGLWLPIYTITAAHAANCCAFYLRLAKAQVHPADLAETRQSARSWLVEMAYLAPTRESIGLMTADGLDADIVDLCAQWG